MIDSPLVQFIICGAVASAIAGIELGGSLETKATFRAAHWIIIRIAIDLATAIMAILILKSALPGVDWFSGAWPAIVAGLCGPALVRSQLAILGSGQEERCYGPANVYSRLRERIDSSIDDIGAAARSTWISEKAAPQIRNIPLEELGEIIKIYIRSLKRLSEQEKKQGIRFIDSILSDEETLPKEKIAALLNWLLDNGAIRLIKRLERNGEKLSPGINSGEKSAIEN